VWSSGRGVDDLKHVGDVPGWFDKLIFVYEAKFAMPEEDKPKLVDVCLGIWAIARIRLKQEEDFKTAFDDVSANVDRVFPEAYFEDLISVVNKIAKKIKYTDQDHQDVVSRYGAMEHAPDYLDVLKRMCEQLSKDMKRIMEDHEPAEAPSSIAWLLFGRCLGLARPAHESAVEPADPSVAVQVETHSQQSMSPSRLAQHVDAMDVLEGGSVASTAPSPTLSGHSSLRPGAGLSLPLSERLVRFSSNRSRDCAHLDDTAASAEAPSIAAAPEGPSAVASGQPNSQLTTVEIRTTAPSPREVVAAEGLHFSSALMHQQSADDPVIRAPDSRLRLAPLPSL